MEQKETLKIPYGKTVWRILKFNIVCAPWQTALCICMTLIYGLLPVLVTYTWKQFLTGLENGKSESLSQNGIPGSLVLYVVAYGVSLGLPIMLETSDSILRNAIKKIAYKKLHGKARRLPFAYFDDPRMNDFIKKASESMHDGAFMYFVMGMGYLAGYAATVVAMGILLWGFHPVLAVTVQLMFLPVAARFALSKRITALKHSQMPKRREAELYTDFMTDRKYVKETKIWDTSGYFLRKRQKLTKELVRQERQAYTQVYCYEMLLDFFESLVYMACIGTGIWLCVQGRLASAELGALFSAVSAAYYADKRLVDESVSLRKDIHDVYEGFRLFDLEEENREGRQVSLGDGIRMENVDFSYPGVERLQAEGVSFSLKEGEIIALAGENGAGKSTIVKLLLGLYVPKRGQVVYGGTDISKVEYETLFGSTSAVYEDYNRYKVTLGENIALEGEMDREKAEEILKELGFSLEKYPDGFDTMLGKEFGGLDLSGGEWQKLAMARGYYRQGDIIVLDEPTAALDARSEYAVYENFRRICRGRTGVIVTHRLGAARLADRVLYVENGHIAEQGTHEELMALGGKYAHMFQVQKEMYMS